MSDTTIAHWVSIVGWLGMLATWSWLLWRWLRANKPKFVNSD